MKAGDIIRVKLKHHHRPGWIGVIVGDFATSPHNKGKAFRVRFTDGVLKTMMASNLEAINENR